MPTAKPLSPLEKLKKAANLIPVKQDVVLSNGEAFEFWCTPMTFAEREAAMKGSNDDPNAFALKLLIQKATDENGRRMFAAGHTAELKNEVKAQDLDKLLKAIVNLAAEEEAEHDPKG